jgi:subtilase family protein
MRASSTIPPHGRIATASLYVALLVASGCGSPRRPHEPVETTPEAASAGGRTTLHVHDLVFDPLSSPAKLPAALRSSEDTRYHIVQYESGQGPAVYAAIHSAGGRSFGPVAHHGLLVGGLARKRLEALNGVRAVEPYHPAYKLDPALARLATAGGAQVQHVVVFVFDEPHATARAIEALGGVVRAVDTAAGGQVLEVELSAAGLAPLAALPEVRLVERGAVPLALLDNAPVLMNVRNGAGPPWQNLFGLDGTGQVLGIYDTGCDTGDSATLVQDLQNRVSGDTANWGNTWWTTNVGPPSWADLKYNGTNPDSHGTMVTDAAIGNGASSPTGLLTGVAFGATAVMRPFNADSAGLTPGYLNLDRALTNAYGLGARVHNDSWAAGIGTYPAPILPVVNQYDQQTSGTVDAFTRSTWDMLVVVAAANAGLPSTIGDVGCAKNSLTVGASGNGAPPTGAAPGGQYNAARGAALVATFSSRGPAPGGRLKPEVVAPGAMVALRCSQSTQATCANTKAYLGQPNFAYAAGTSFAAPLVSGTALLVRQYLVNVVRETYPTGMLVKAVLVNGAQPIANYVPNNNQGWGRINLNASLTANNGAVVAYYDSLNAAGGSFQFVNTGQVFQIPNAVFVANAPVAITLTWYDPPDLGNTGLLINDLDLALVAGANTYHGGVASMQNGQTLPNGGRDTVNNTEKIILNAPPAVCTTAPGCTISITATTIAAGQPQPFAVVASGLAQVPEAKRAGTASGALRPLRSPDPPKRAR